MKTPSRQPDMPVALHANIKDGADIKDMESGFVPIPASAAGHGSELSPRRDRHRRGCQLQRVLEAGQQDGPVAVR